MKKKRKNRNFRKLFSLSLTRKFHLILIRFFFLFFVISVSCCVIWSCRCCARVYRWYTQLRCSRSNFMADFSPEKWWNNENFFRFDFFKLSSDFRTRRFYFQVEFFSAGGRLKKSQLETPVHGRLNERATTLRQWKRNKLSFNDLWPKWKIVIKKSYVKNSNQRNDTWKSTIWQRRRWVHWRHGVIIRSPMRKNNNEISFHHKPSVEQLVTERKNIFEKKKTCANVMNGNGRDNVREVFQFYRTKRNNGQNMNESREATRKKRDFNDATYSLVMIKVDHYFIHSLWFAWAFVRLIFLDATLDIFTTNHYFHFLCRSSMLFFLFPFIISSTIGLCMCVSWYSTPNRRLCTHTIANLIHLNVNRQAFSRSLPQPIHQIISKSRRRKVWAKIQFHNLFLCSNIFHFIFDAFNRQQQQQKKLSAKMWTLIFVEILWFSSLAVDRLQNRAEAMHRREYRARNIVSFALAAFSKEISLFINIYPLIDVQLSFGAVVFGVKCFLLQLLCLAKYLCKMKNKRDREVLCAHKYRKCQTNAIIKIHFENTRKRQTNKIKWKTFNNFHFQWNK